MAPSPVPAPTVVFVHAHPDDESLFTGGRTILGARAGVRQVLVTMTDGALGIDPRGAPPLDPAHDRVATATARSGELRRAAAILGFSRVVELGHPDSGMAGWPTMDDPRAFVNRPSGQVARQLAEVLDEEGPCVVVTYDATGFYGHPDHVATHVAVVAAVEATGSVERLEAVAMTQDDVERALRRAAAVGEALPEWLGRRLVTLVDAAAIDVVVDARAVAGVKQAALAEHVTQIDNRALVGLDPALFGEVFGVERYVTLIDRASPPPA